MQNPLADFVADIQQRVTAEISRVGQHDFASGSVGGVTDGWASPRTRSRLQWRDAQWRPTDVMPLPLEEARAELLQVMLDYATRPVKRPGEHPILLVRAAPGVGKTHAAVQVAQQAGRAGIKVLYAMPTHAHFYQLEALPVFEGQDWYHWLGTDAPVPLTPDETMCRESDTTSRMMSKGWPLRLACESLCQFWQPNCDYKAQRWQPELVIAGVHEHITTGLDSSGSFGLVIIDEEPMRALLQPRRIHKDDIWVGSYAGPVTQLQATLLALCKSGATYRGKQLLDEIGDLLGDVFAQIEDPDILIPAMPPVSSREDIAELPAWFLPDLLVLLASEYEAWRRGLPSWLERVVIFEGVLYLYKRQALWKELPDRCIVIDATADIDVYRQMFPGRKLTVYEPPTAPAGDLIQITGSYIGAEQIEQNADLWVATVRELAREHQLTRPGVVTFLKAVPKFEEVFGAGRVAHFGGQRGSNDLSDADGGFVVGSYSPPDSAIEEIVKTLNPGRIEDFHREILPSGVAVPLRTSKLVEFSFTNSDGLSPWRMLSGLWDDPDLVAILRGRREAELVQAVHRFRLQTRAIPVWLLSSVPTGIPLAAIYDDPPIGPPGIPWRTWLKISEWLGNQSSFGYEELAAAAGVSVKHARNQQWLDRIAENDPQHWKIDRLVKASGAWRRSIIKA